MRRVIEEINWSIRGPLRNIYQLTKVDYYLLFQDGTVRISLNPSHSFISISERMKENPSMPPSFTLLLRKFLRNARFLGVEQIGFSRVAIFKFRKLDEKGDLVDYELHAEIMGKFSNLILVKDGKVVDAHRRISTRLGREIFPGKIFNPFKSDKIDPFSFDPEMLREEGGKLEKILVSKIEGLSKTLAREIVFRCGCDFDVRMEDVDLSKLGEAFEEFLSEYSLEKTYTLYEGESPVDISPVVLKHTNFRHVEKSPSSAVNSLYVFLEMREALEQKKRNLKEIVEREIERIENALEKIFKEYEESRNFDVYRKYGELLLAYAYEIDQNSETAKLKDWETGEEIDVKIDKSLGPVKTAQRYFKIYEKLKRKKETLGKRIGDLERDRSYLEQLLQMIENAENEEDMESVREELERIGLIRERKKGRSGKSQPRRFEYKGFTILVGRNNIQNDELVRSASPKDVWLHAHEIPGAHVIIKTGGREVPEDVLRFAASLAAKYSRGKDSGYVPVDYTLAKYVKKPKGFKPGMVIYTDYKTLKVEPKK